MASTRLPGKIMAPLAGRPMLEHVVNRSLACQVADTVCVATTTDASDDITANWSEEFGIRCFRGSMNNVLGRYRQVVDQLNTDIVVRVTADCPMLDPQIVDALVRAFKEKGESVDYVANDLNPTFPIGMGVEALSADLLKYLDDSVKDASEREHVTLHIQTHPENYSVLSVVNATDFSKLRLTVDAPEDYELAKHVFNSLDSEHQGRIFGLGEVSSLLDANPQWVRLNSSIQQRIVSQETGLIHGGASHFKDWQEIEINTL